MMIPHEVSDFTLEQYVLDELRPPVRLQVEQLISTSPSLQAKVQRLKLDNERFHREHPSEKMLKGFRPDDVPRKRWGRRRIQFSLAGLGVAALVVVLPLITLNNPGADTRIKGFETQKPVPMLDDRSSKIAVFLLQGEHYLALKNGSQAHENDRIQVALKIDRDHYALLLSIDGTGHLTLQAPDSLRSPLKAEGDSPILLPFAYQLDNAPEFERFVLITGSKAFDPRNVWNQVQSQTTAWMRIHPGTPPVLHLDQELETSFFDILKPSLHKDHS